MKKIIYMDHAATTPVNGEVLKEMIPFYTDYYGNPSSIYSISRETKKAIETARSKVSHAINADPSEIYFTGGGSEADNFAIKGIAFANKNKGNHIITSNIEHHAVLHTCEFLEKNGFEVTYLKVNEEGLIDLNELKNAITEKTILVSIMFANNEIGTIEPIEEIGKICREKKVLFHTDAVQAVGAVPIDVKKLNIDLLSLAAHKIYGPKGVGALYVRKGVRIENLVHGGAQEKGRRAGTENLAGIVGLGKAIELATTNLEEKNKKITYLRDKLINGIVEKIPYSIVNGALGDKRLPNNVNVCFKFIEGEGILLMLDDLGICASSGSACTSGSLDPSHVLLAIGRPHEIAHGSLRLSIGEKTTEPEIEYVLQVLPSIVNRLRDLSPLWSEFKKEESLNV